MHPTLREEFLMCDLTDQALEKFFSIVSPLLNERQRRLHAAAVVQMLGPGGQSRVATVSGMSRSTLIRGAKELADGVSSLEHVRRKGGGRKKSPPDPVADDSHDHGADCPELQLCVRDDSPELRHQSLQPDPQPPSSL
jgi:hypothetical protein